MSDSVHIRVPASSANFGSGFDCIGVALAVYDELTVKKAEQEQFIVNGPYSLEVPLDRTNLIFIGMQTAFYLAQNIDESLTTSQIKQMIYALSETMENEIANKNSRSNNQTEHSNQKKLNSIVSHSLELPPFKYTYVKNIPIARGLGSSAVAVILGLLAGFRIFQIPLNTDDQQDMIFFLACTIEGHADNVAPSLYGGVQLVWVEEKKMEETASQSHIQSYEYMRPKLLKEQRPRETHTSLPFIHRRWRHKKIALQQAFSCVVFIPVIKLSTSVSRDCLPAYLPQSDCVFNLARVALLINALNTGQLNDLKEATRDMLHQACRAKLYIPFLYPVIEAGLNAGAYAVYLSGSGPSIMALTPYASLDKAEQPSSTQTLHSIANVVSQAMTNAAKEFHIDGITVTYSIAEQTTYTADQTSQT